MRTSLEAGEQNSVVTELEKLTGVETRSHLPDYDDEPSAAARARSR